jgi:autophagy-related protein 13
MLTSISAVDERLREMNEAFEASLAGFPGDRMTGGRARSDSSPSGVRRELHTPDFEDPGLLMIGRSPRPRYGSMGSVHSGFSIASEEVIGKLELEERRSKGSSR